MTKNFVTENISVVRCFSASKVKDPGGWKILSANYRTDPGYPGRD